MKHLTVGLFLLIFLAAIVIGLLVPQAAVDVREAERHPHVFSMGGRREPGRARAAGIQRRSPASRQRAADETRLGRSQ